MDKRITSPKKVKRFLEELKEIPPRNIAQLASEHGLSHNYSPILIGGEFVKKTENGWKWVGGKISEEYASTIKDFVQQYTKAER